MVVEAKADTIFERRADEILAIARANLVLRLKAGGGAVHIMVNNSHKAKVVTTAETEIEFSL